MKKLILLLLGAFLLSGCFQYKRELILNPDGSGKMILETEIMKGLSFGAEQDEKETMKTAVANLIKSSEGIEAWTGISYKMTEANMIAFKGTAYFKDVTKIKLYNVNAAGIETEKLPNGEIRLTLLRGGKTSKEEQAKVSAKKGKKITPENVGEELARQRAQYKKIRPMLSAIYAMTDNEDIITIFGEVKEYKNITKLDDGRFRYVFKGEEAGKELDALLDNDELMKKTLLEDGALMSTGLESMNIVKNIGEKLGKSVIVYTPKAGRAFDFEQEVLAAKAEMKNIAKELDPKSAPAAQKMTANYEFKASRLAAITLKNYDPKIKGPAFGGNLTEVVFQGVFDGSVVIVDKVELLKAVAEDGGDIAVPKEFYTINPNLNPAGDTVQFAIYLKSLPKGSLGIKELSGKCRVLTASGTAFVDAGFKELKEGEAGSELGAKISTIKERPAQKRGLNKGKAATEESDEEIRIDVKLGFGLVKSVKILDEKGNEMKFSDGGKWGGDNSLSITCNLEGKVPLKGKILLEVYKDLKEGSAAFKFENIKLADFTGAPELKR